MHTETTTEEIKAYTKETIIYICDVCGKKSESKVWISDCEMRHACVHVPEYEFDQDDGDSWFRADGIIMKCELCGLKLGRVDFEDFGTNQRVLKNIYELLSGKP